MLAIKLSGSIYLQYLAAVHVFVRYAVLCLVMFFGTLASASRFLPALCQLHLVWLKPSRRTSDIEDSSFLQANAQKVQRRLMNKPCHPAELAADIVERVVATGAEPYLETRMHSLTWWQLTHLDVKLLLLMIAAVAIVATGILGWCIVRAVKIALARTLGCGRHQSVPNDKKQS